MPRRQLAAAVAALTLPALLIAGCTAMSPKPSATPSGASTAKPADQVDDTPSARFFVLCQDLVDVNALGSGLVPVEDTVPTWPAGVAAEQAGMLDCAWQHSDSAPQGDVGVDPAIVVTAVPDAASAGEKQISAMMSYQNQPAVDGHVGDASAVDCHVSNGLTCRASFVQNGVWLFVGLYGPFSQIPDTVDAARAATEHIASAALHQLRTPAKAWNAPSSPWVPSDGCSALSADPSSVAGVGSGHWGEWNRPGDDDPARMYARYDAGWTRNCVWATPGVPGGAQLSAQIVGDGAWAWGRLGSAVDQTSMPVTVAGADQAAYRCNMKSGFCYLDAIAAGTWFQVQFLQGGTADESTKLAQIAASLIAAKP